MKIGTFFENFLKKRSLFSNKAVLFPSYAPEEIKYREEQLEQIANILAPALRLEKPSNLFIYGKTGTGKTISVKHIFYSLQETAAKNKVNLLCIYVNCKLKRVADTEYRLIAQLLRECGKEVPATGLPTDELYNLFYTALDEKPQVVLVALDEIDQLAKKIGDEIFYNLTRINAELKQAQISIIGISNSLFFSENLDPRVKSSLSEEEIIFPSYNALQIQNILRGRAAGAFREQVIQPGVLEKGAAYAAREHGDVRRAIDVLRIAGEIAEREASSVVEMQHLDKAEKKLESDRVFAAALQQPQQFQLVLYAILLIAPQKKNVFTGEIYEVYQTLCHKKNLNVLTQRRLSDILAELDMLGIITAKIISKGRYGRTREISLSLDDTIIITLRELLEKSLHLE